MLDLDIFEHRKKYLDRRSVLSRVNEAENNQY